MTTDNASNPDPVPPPTPDLTDGGEPQEVDLLADIKPGGLLDKMLDRSKVKPQQGDPSWLLVELQQCVLKLRKKAENRETSLKSQNMDYEPGEICKYILRCSPQNQDVNPVLCYCLWRHWDLDDVEDETFQAACQKYGEKPDAYDQVLGDFIPSRFCKVVRDHIAEQRFASGVNLTAAEDWSGYLLRLQNRRKRERQGISTGLPQLNSAIGGLRGLTFLGGGPGAGKTSLALSIAANALRLQPNLGVMFYSLDMHKSVLMDRLLCQEAGVDYADLIRAKPDERVQERLEAAQEKLLSDILPRLRIVDCLTVEKDRSALGVINFDIAAFFKKVSIASVLMVFDYFQLLPVDTKAPTALDADFERVKLLQGIQDWGRTNQNPDGFPILAISEVRKGESGRTELSVADLMGSARLGYSAETILLLETPNQMTASPTVPVRLHIAKSRDGTVRGTIDLVFEHTKARFREATTRPSRKPRSKSTRETAVPKADQGQIDPLAGLEGS